MFFKKSLEDIPYLTAGELAAEKRCFHGHHLCQSISRDLESMNLALEIGDLELGRQYRPELTTKLQELHQLLACAKELGSIKHQSPQAESLQAFRREALRDLEHLGLKLKASRAGPWRTPVSLHQKKVISRAILWSCIIFTMTCLALTAWVFGQNLRQARLTASINAAKGLSSLESLKLISLMAWQARANNPRLPSMLKDMSQACSGQDLKTVLPNHPCRQAWEFNRKLIFNQATPQKAAPLDAPSEVFFDPWQSPYVVLTDPVSGKMRIISPGPDGMLGSGDNISLNVPYW